MTAAHLVDVALAVSLVVLVLAYDQLFMQGRDRE